jgi:hypothetical protein|tara:strand:+ start:244 stop:402 length:159 start_codon:yes stop_codon:yes gene_type:complete
MDEKITLQRDDKIKLNRGMKGTYGWEITLTSLDVDELKKIDTKLREEFKNEY